MPVRKTGALPEPIDRQVNEIIRAFSEMEEQIRQIRKASDSRIGDNAEYIDRHVRNLNNPHSVTAKQVKALPLAFVLDPSSICFPFQNSLVSTRGETPIGLYGSSITDYGLVTGNGLCATLLPEGGVAVTEGTTNLVTDQSFWNTRTGAIVTRELVTSGQWAGWYKVHVTRTGTRNYIGNTQRISVAIDTTHTWSIDFYSETGKVKPRLDGYYGIGNLSRVGERRWALTWTNNRGSEAIQEIYFYHSDGAEIDVDEVFYYRRYQVEAQPYDTPYVEGTRPAGSLSYNLPISINGDWTIAKWMELEPYFMDKSYSGDKPIGKFRLPLLELGKTYYTEGHGTLGIYGAWADSQPGKTICIMANKDQVITYSSDTITLTEAEYNNKILAVLTKSGSMLTAYIYTVENRYVLTCNTESLGDLSQIAPLLNYHTVTTGNRMYCKRHLNTLVCPYAVSPATIATWHSLDAPFIDPFIPPSQGVPYFNTPGEFINSTANFAMVNVDSLVKLYARTPDKTIIIETLGNTEVV